MPKTMPISDLQRNFKAVTEECAESKEPIYLTRNGKPALVVMDVEAYEEEQSLKQLIYEREMRTLAALDRAHEQFEQGTCTSLEDARAMRESWKTEHSEDSDGAD